MKTLYVDMDGVLCKFHPEKSLEEITEPGYFYSLEPASNVVNAIKVLAQESNLDIQILSHVFDGTAKGEKLLWLDEHLPGFKSIFVPYGMAKSVYLKKAGLPVEDAILLDDFTKNLREWPGTGIKLLNGINNTHHTWDGFMLNGKSDAKTLAKGLKALVLAS